MSNEATDEFGIPNDLTTPVVGEKAKKAKPLDPEEDRANWPTIFIDFEDGKPNYEYIGVSGTLKPLPGEKEGRPFTHSLQVQRGVDVVVPPSVVNMLRSTKQTHYHQTADPVTGRQVMHQNDRAPLPWRLIEKGKYC